MYRLVNKVLIYAKKIVFVNTQLLHNNTQNIDNINLLDNTNLLNDNMCPKHWWYQPPWQYQPSQWQYVPKTLMISTSLTIPTSLTTLRPIFSDMPSSLTIQTAMLVAVWKSELAPPVREKVSIDILIDRYIDIEIDSVRFNEIFVDRSVGRSGCLSVIII